VIPTDFVTQDEFDQGSPDSAAHEGLVNVPANLSEQTDEKLEHASKRKAA
jgi:hypothetical protein